MRRSLWVILAAGLALRVVILLADTRSYDVANFLRAHSILRAQGFDSYGALTADAVPAYPYPPLFLAYITALPEAGFTKLVRIPPVLADLALAWLVARHLGGRRGVVGAALLALGPAAWDTSAAQGQIDAVAILPCLAGALWWMRGGGWRVGLLIGLGGAIKLPALLAVLGLLPTARTVREGAAVLAAAGGVVAATLVPFAIADAGAVLDALRYHGLPGLGGLSVILGEQAAYDLSALNAVFLALGLAATLTLLVRRRIAPLPAIAAVFLVAYVCGVNWSVQYLMWALPFVLASGWLVEAAAMLVLTMGMEFRLWSTNERHLGDLYARIREPLEAVSMGGLYVVWIATLARRLGSRALRRWT
jgi:hypothetical protein